MNSVFRSPIKRLKQSFGSPLKRLLSNPFGAVLVALKPIAIAIFLLAAVRVVFGSSYPPEGTLAVFVMFPLGMLAQRYNRGIFMGDKDAYEYNGFWGKLKGLLLAGLGFAVIMSALRIITISSF